MKRMFTTIFAAIFAVLLGVTTLTACGTDTNSTQSTGQEKKLSVVTTIFPQYDWVRQIAGDNAEVTMLLDNGVDLHSYQPTAEDILKISTCDLFIYVGGESDAWVESALKEAKNPNMQVINLLDILGNKAKEEEQIEGMETEHDETDHNETDQEETELDEHVWLSLKNAQIFCKEICEKLSALDPNQESTYQANAEKYLQQLSDLDQKYTKTVNDADQKVLLFGDRFPFRYLTDDYGITYYAAFPGCSAETEASFETITFLANKVDSLKLPAILTIEGTEHKIAETICSNTTDKNQKILTLDSMQSVTSKDVANGDTYLSIMEQNLSVLQEALH